MEKSYALAAVWRRATRKAADQGDATGQFDVGRLYAYGKVGVKKDLPQGKAYLELSAAQGGEDAVALLKELSKCVACGKLDVHHIICSRCRNRRYCDPTCQLQHWNNTTDPHRVNCAKRREAAGAGDSADRAVPSAGSTHRGQADISAAVEATAAAAAAAAETRAGLKEALEATAAAAATEVPDTEKAKAVAAATAAVKLEASGAAAVALSATAAEAVTAATAATAALLAAPAASKKEKKKKKAKFGAKVKAAEAAMQAAVEAAKDAWAAFEAATAVLQAAAQAAM